MKRVFVLIVSALLVLSLLAACSGKSSSEPMPAQSSEAAAQSSQEPAGQPGEPSQAESLIPEESSALEESVEESIEESVPEEPAVTLEFDSRLYQNPNDDDIYNVLTYASNSGDTPAMVTFRYKAIDTEGNALSVFNMFTGKYSESFRDTVFIPAGAEDFPLAFSLPGGFKYDVTQDKEMPEIDHMEFEILEIENIDQEDLKEHFTPGEPEIRNNHIYIYVKFDQEIGDNYASLYPNYTLLGYSNDVLTTVCCANNYPVGTSSFSVAYAKENNDSAFLIYNQVPNDPIDKWELYLGCVGAQK